MKGKGTNKECPHLDDHLLNWKSKMKRGRKYSQTGTVKLLS
jgi:hypothetical protein